MPLVPVRLLLVEGQEDARVIPELIESASGLPWGQDETSWMATIKVALGKDRGRPREPGGNKKLLERGYIATEYKTARLQALGVILDADEDPAGRWQALCNCDLPFAAELPEEPPKDGLVLQPKAGGPRFGAWLMPDNRALGMLETFLLTLRPDGPDPALWQWADEVVKQAQTNGAPFRPTHHDKARVHTFLAWQDPPGRQLHQAIQQRFLDPRSAAAAPFVDWFRRLFRV